MKFEFAAVLFAPLVLGSYTSNRLGSGHGSLMRRQGATIVCEDGLFLEGNQCVKRYCKASACKNTIPDNATRYCNSEKLCDFKCLTGFTRNGESCEAVPVCQVDACENDVPGFAHRICDAKNRCNWQCNDGYYRKNGACIKRKCRPELCTNEIPANAYRTCRKNECDFLCSEGFRWNGSECLPGLSACKASACKNEIPVNSHHICSAGKCAFACDSGFSLIGGQCVAGCPAGFTQNPVNLRCYNLASDSKNCGSYGNVCEYPYSGDGYGSCRRGECTIICRNGQSLRVGAANGLAYCA